HALYWLEEYHFDGLRLDAIHAVHDTSATHIVTEIARAARAGPGRTRPIYLTLENLNNAVRFLGAAGAAGSCDAQWNDDTHHSLHVLLTGESQAYYADYARDPHALLARGLAEGFVYQGEVSRYLGGPRGESSAHLPPSAFVNFLQNHDQVGNRARGERLTTLARASTGACSSRGLMRAPSPFTGGCSRSAAPRSRRGFSSCTPGASRARTPAVPSRSAGRARASGCVSSPISAPSLRPCRRVPPAASSSRPTRNFPAHSPASRSRPGASPGCSSPRREPPRTARPAAAPRRCRRAARPRHSPCHLSAAAQRGLHLPRCDGARSVPGLPRRQPRLLLAVLPRPRGQHARLRRGRSQLLQSRDR